MRCETRIAEFVDFNPSRPLKRNALAPFVDMAALPESQRDIASLSEREFTGGGSRFRNGDTLFARITPCLENGKTAKVGVLPAGITAHGSTEFIVMAAKAPEFDEDFVYYLARHPDFRKFAEARMEGTSGRQRVSWQSLSEYTFPFPPPVERKRIGCVLRTLDDKIALNRRINQTLEAMAQAIFKSWFVDFDPVKAKIAAKAEGRDPLRAAMTAISGKPDAELDTLPPDQFAPLAATAALFPDEMEVSELGDIPRGWHAASVYEIADVIYGAPFSSKRFNSVGKGLPIVRIRDLRDESPAVWTDEAHPKGYMLTKGDIVVGMDGEFRAYLWGGEPAWLNQRVCVFKPRAPHSAAFVRCSIAAPLAHIEATEVATTVIHLGKGDIDKFLIVVPDEAISIAYALMADAFYAQVVSNKTQVRQLSGIRDTLLPKLLSGELLVQNIEMEAAA